MKELNLTTRSGGTLAGRRGEEIEAAVGDIREKREEIPGGWEWIWMEDPWTHKWEQVRVPHEEAEKRRQLGLKPRPSYWGETDQRVVPKAERGARGRGPQIEEEEGMAYCRVTEAGGFPGPWLADDGEGSSWGDWSGDEETLPLITLEEEELNPMPGDVKPLTGPWNLENTNPFINSLWTPLKPSLELQESLNPFLNPPPHNVDVAINTEPFDLLPPSRPLLEVPTAPETEPSQSSLFGSTYICEQLF